MMCNIVGVCSLVLALAQDAPTSFRDGQGVLDALKAEVSPEDVVAAIEGSETKFRPRDVYALVDGGAPEEVTRAMAGKAGVFVSDDVLMTLSEFASGARGGAADENIKVASGGFGAPLVRLATLGSDKEAAIGGQRRIARRAEDETIRAYDSRVREGQREQVLATAQIDGQIEAVTLILSLKVADGGYDDSTGCGVLVVDESIDMDYIPFRGAMGVDDRETLVTLDTRTMAHLGFEATPLRRFSARSKDVCMSSSDFQALLSETILKGSIRRTAEGAWTGDVDMVDSYGDRIRTRR